ncbi:hypothetical protein IF1G_07751 [Cordyceps javanica]|uniref:Uncharacterized protein n=1 Tax=Cordyceps javanica TaxID=43265 RepID=A0A545UX28_9HYPO|nr:hypothetical protein IF1G_07751 [Cordyceps javanica]
MAGTMLMGKADATCRLDLAESLKCLLVHDAGTLAAKRCFCVSNFRFHSLATACAGPGRGAMRLCPRANVDTLGN